MNSISRDIRYALRQLLKGPGFTATAVLTLAFGIGATTAIFSIVEGVLLRPLPFADPKSLVAVGDLLEGTNFTTPSVPAYESLLYARGTHSFSSMGAYRQTAYELSGAGDPAQVGASRLNAGVFSALGVSPLMGRVFTAQEDDGSEQVVVISYQTWRSRFHSNPGILGTKIELDRKPYVVIGVMPRQFEFPLVPGQLNRSELWVPISFSQGDLENGKGSWNFQMVGRLKPGISPAQAQQDAQAVTQEIMRNLPGQMSTLRLRAAVERLDEATVESSRPLVRMLFGAVAVVLFIACANLAGLLMVRVIRRRREISVRLALGARASAIVRQNLIETLALSISGGLLGLLLAAVALRVGVSFLPETLPRISSIGLDWAVIGFALLLAVITGLICGLVPALAATRTDVNDALKEGGRTGTAGANHARLRSTLVVVELAVALVLLTGAGLLLRSFENLRAVDMGFRTDHMLTASYSLPRQQYSTQASVDGFNQSLLMKLRQLPSVQAVGITSSLPGSGDTSNGGFVAEGYTPPKGAELQLGWPSQILGDYFRAAGIPVIRGRGFTDADRADSPLGRHRESHPGGALLARPGPHRQAHPHRRSRETPLPWMTVVGEIADIKQTTADGDIAPQFYEPPSQLKKELGMFASPDMLTGAGGSIILRSGMAPEQMADSLRAVVRSIDPQLPLTQVESMDRVVAEGQAPRRFNAALISSFAGAAVLLAILGIYSVIAFSAALRTHEMAIRMALGSQRSSVMTLIIVSGAKLGLAGCIIGGIGAIFAARLFRSLLFQVNPLDPLVLALAAVSIFALALLASLVPARRAASVEPMQALRME